MNKLYQLHVVVTTKRPRLNSKDEQMTDKHGEPLWHHNSQVITDSVTSEKDARAILDEVLTRSKALANVESIVWQGHELGLVKEKRYGVVCQRMKKIKPLDDCAGMYSPEADACPEDCMTDELPEVTASVVHKEIEKPVLSDDSIM